MPGKEASVASHGGDGNGSDSLTDVEGDGKLTECRGVAREQRHLADMPTRGEKRCKPKQK
jgi:hypothetical protein